MPQGWTVSFNIGKEAKKASITVDFKGKTAHSVLDDEIFNDPNVPEGCKIFMIFHETGHLIYGPDEAACDRYAFYHSLRYGVSPFLCYVAVRAFLTGHNSYRIKEMFDNIMQHQHLKNDA